MPAIEGAENHTPVLAHAVCELLAPKASEVILDGTVGLGGHARLLGEKLGSAGWIIGLDVDPANLKIAEQRLANLSCRSSLHRENFRAFDEVLASLKVDAVDVMLLDLGVASSQLDDFARGFSFRSEGPLDMRMDDRLRDTAADLVNRLTERQLADLIFHHSQEPGSRRIAKRICQVRREGRITTTQALVKAVASALGVDPLSRKSKIHPATRTFQALRMAVNDELGALEEFLTKAPGYLRPKGRLGVISFHSLEDRLVKRDFVGHREDGTYRIVTKKPVVADEEERRSNPRSRSAKLRVVERT